jgi:hypothetical protein
MTINCRRERLVVARPFRKKVGRAFLLCLSTSEVNLFRYRKSIVVNSHPNAIAREFTVWSGDTGPRESGQWVPFAVVDGHLVRPASSASDAQELLKLLQDSEGADWIKPPSRMPQSTHYLFDSW